MSDAISLPSNWTFQEMLSHTFPGFFSAISIFMLMDYLSPQDLTSWAITDVTTLISFAGFILIIGTILGVIIDAIHHTFIEDDIFDNFEQIQIIKKPINNRLKNLCSEFGELFTRHTFLAKMGGDKAIALEDHLDKAYYRYSEFYSNIFVSLILFSLISPLYAFKILNLPWQISKYIGLASLIIACLSLVGSYTTYKQYLQAQCSLICGFNLNEDKNCKLGCKIESEFDDNQIVADLDKIQMSDEILREITECIKERSSKEIEFLNKLKYIKKIRCDKDVLENIIQKSKKEQEAKSNELLNNLNKCKEIKYIKLQLIHKLKQCDSSVDVLQGISSVLTKGDGILERLSKLSLIFLIIALLSIFIYILTSSAPVSLGIEPGSINLSENLTAESSLMNPFDILILKNYGDDLNISFKINGIEERWVSIKDNDTDIKATSIFSGKTRYLRIGLFSRYIFNESVIPGTYKGSIEIFYDSHDGLNTKYPDIEIPLTINLNVNAGANQNLSADDKSMSLNNSSNEKDQNPSDS